MSLISKIRRATSTTNDDFFRSEAILQYINAAKQRVVSEMIRLQNNPETNRSVKALNKLRRVAQPVVTQVSSVTDYNEESITLPTDLKEIMYVGMLNGTKPIQVRELSSEERTLLNWGSIKPSSLQAYYYVVGGATPELTIYTADVEAGSTLWIHYIANPVEVTLYNEATIALDDIPVQLHNAVIYAACEMMGIQEQSANTQNFAALYEEEIQLNAY